MGTTFKDSFSTQSDIYLKHRPNYPDSLYAYLSSLVPRHELVWDCGTGNGQAAIGLADFFEQVIATEPSSNQLGQAVPHAKVAYRNEAAEQSSLSSHSADLVTVANAMHWFKLEEFYKEVRRVVKPGGVLAAWCYGMPEVTTLIDEVVRHLHDDVLGSYWQYENRLVELEYRTIPFPFEELECPRFYSEKTVTFEDLLGYLNTWSATQRYIADRGDNPVSALQREMQQAWGAAEERTVRWKLTLKVGRVS